MISELTQSYLKASVPVLKEHGLTITKTFYHNMFQEYPQLKSVFNMGNQAQGVQPQSLAATVFAYAAHVDNLNALVPVLQRIAHKHAAVGIQPDHYPIVGKHLIGAIKEVLGDAATEPLITAWEDAYNVLADMLITAEHKLYAASGAAAGELIAVNVHEVIDQSDTVKTFVLAAAGSEPLPLFVAGQYVSVEMQLENGVRQLRQYSLSGSPLDNMYRISVKRIDQGETPEGQVSQWLHRQVQKGNVLRISPPFGEFQLHLSNKHTTPILFLSAGIGVTPLLSMLKHLAHVSYAESVMWYQAARNTSELIFMEEVEQLKQNNLPQLQTQYFADMTECDVAHITKGPMQMSGLDDIDVTNVQVYMCGPSVWMNKMRTELMGKGVAVNHIYREVFGPELLEHLQ